MGSRFLTIRGMVYSKHLGCVSPKHPLLANRKDCPRCGVTKALIDFSSCSKSKDGRSFYCRDCHSEKRREKRDKIASQPLAARVRERAKEQVAYASARSKEYGVCSALTAEEWSALVMESGGRCCYCGKQVGELNLVLEHITPMARGGGTVVGNVAPACADCNMSKGRLTKEEFMEKRVA